MAKSESVKSGVEAWRRMLTDCSERIVGEVKWNDDLIVICQDRVITGNEADHLRVIKLTFFVSVLISITLSYRLKS